MKKIFSFLIGAIMLIGFNSCKKNLSVTEDNIVGKWEMTAMIVDGHSSPADGQIWELTKDHLVYQYSGYNREKVEAGEWRLESKKLYLDFIPWPMTVAKLTSKTLKLEAYDDEENILMFSYTFDKVK